MATNKELRDMSDEELLNAIEDKKHEMYTLRINRATGELKDSNAIKYARRDVARLKTVIRERELAKQLTSDAGKKKKNG